MLHACVERFDKISEKFLGGKIKKALKQKLEAYLLASYNCF